ncbi:MAG: AIR synthase-related protein [bacterium]
MRKKRLLSFSRAAGCAGKACQADLFAILEGLPGFSHPDLLVSGATADDAGVFRLDKKRALVLTVDVMPPIADDPLILTKPLGTGVITTALKMNRAPAPLVAEANRLMTGLNQKAAAVMSAVGVNAATDITGFGLMGHAWELAQASSVDLMIKASAVPFISGGLLISVPERKSKRLQQALRQAGVTQFKEVGRVVVGTGKVRAV